MSDRPPDAPPPEWPGAPPSGSPGFDPGPPPGPGWWLAADGCWYSPEQQPGYAYGTWGLSTYPGARAGKWNGYAIAAFVLGLTWVFWIGSVLALIFGPLSLTQIGRTRERGKGLAIAGIALAGAWMLFLLLGLIGLAVSDEEPR